MSQSAEQSRQYTASVECGPYVRKATLAGLTEPAVTRCAFQALAGLADDPAVDVDQLREYLVLSVEETGQMWVYPVDVFLRNLARRPGDQSRAKRALERLEAREAQQ